MAHKIEVAFEVTDRDGDALTVSTDVTSDVAIDEGVILVVTSVPNSVYLTREDAKALAAFLLAEAEDE